MKKKMLLALAVCLLTTGMAFPGETIRVLMAQNIWTDAVKKLIPQFEKETGIKVDMESFHEDQLTQKLSVELTAGAADLDVFVTRPLNEGRMFARNGWYEDLTPYVKDDAEYDFMDFTRAARDCTLINGIQTCIPTSNECQVLYYRKDIFEARGLKPPTTMEELEEVCAKLTNRAKQEYAVAMRGQRSPLVTQFSSFLYSFGGDWNDSNMKATLNTPEAIKAIDFYGSLLRKYGPDGAANLNWPQNQALYHQGKVFMYIDASAHYPMLTDPTKTDLAKHTAVVPFPRGPAGSKPYMVTAMAIAMYKGSKKKDASWTFIRWMTDKERTNQVQGEYGYQCARQSAFENPVGIRNFPKDLAKVIADTGKYAVGYDRPRITAVQQARDVIGEAVTVAIVGNGDVKAAADRANAMYQAILDAEDK